MEKLAIANPFGLSSVCLYDAVPSTMSTVRDQYREEGLSGTVAVTRHQESGRGRIERRQWIDSPGESLLMTLLLEKEDISFSPEQFPLRSGIAVVRLLEEYLGIEARIKWPNDVLIGEKKVCGILCESNGKIFLTGIGLNVLQECFPPGMRREPTSVNLEGARCTDPLELLRPLLDSLKWAYSLDDWKAYVEAHLYRIGEEVSLITGEATDGDPEDRIVRGTLLGLDQSGGLRLGIGEEESVWYSGEFISGSTQGGEE